VNDTVVFSALRYGLSKALVNKGFLALRGVQRTSFYFVADHQRFRQKKIGNVLEMNLHTLVTIYLSRNEM